MNIIILAFAVFSLVITSMLLVFFLIRKKQSTESLPEEDVTISNVLQNISMLVDASMSGNSDTSVTQTVGELVSTNDLYKKVVELGIAVDLKDLFMHQKSGGNPERTLQGMLDFHANGTPLSWAEASALDLSDPGGSTPLFKLI